MKTKRDYQSEIEAYLFDIGLWVEFSFVILLWIAIWIGMIWFPIYLYYHLREVWWVPFVFYPFILFIQYHIANGTRNYFRTITGK